MTTGLQKSSQEHLQRVISQIERLEEEKNGIAEDIADKMKELRSAGFDVKIVKKVLALRKKSQTERDEEDAVLATYMAALGMLADQMGDTPMGDWARSEVSRAEARA